MYKAEDRKGCGGSTLPPGAPPSRHVDVSTGPGALRTPLYGGLTGKAGLIKSLATDNQLHLQPLSPPWGLGVGSGVQAASFKSWLIMPSLAGDQPPS